MITAHTALPNVASSTMASHTLMFSANAHCTGCLVYVNRLMSAQPLVPISAQMRAIIAQQQQQAESGSVPMYALAGGGVPASSTAEGGSSKPAVLAGAVVGGGHVRMPACSL